MQSKRYKVFRRDRYRCVYCGDKRVILTLDHLIPKSRGGSNCPTNLVAACRVCNERKADFTPLEYFVFVVNRYHRAA